MAIASEIHSLEDIHYKSRIKFWLYPIIISFIFIFSFLTYYPVGEELKVFLKKNLKGAACNPDYNEIKMEFFLPKVILTDLDLPAGCLNRSGESLKFSHLTINFHFISFAPFGLPFRIDTEMNNQPLSLYFVQGIGKRLIRLKDQTLTLNRLQPLMGGKFKMAGKMNVDLSALMGSDNSLQELTLKAESRDFQLPSQSIENFTLPSIKVNDLYVEANTENPPRVTVDKMILGDPYSPLRANFKGKIDLQSGNLSFSPLSLEGEIAFTDNFKQSVPLIDLFFQSYSQKDGFYQIRIGGTLGQPKLMNR
jgi:type II secretion system protein N